MTTLADKAILSGADNRPPMLEKDMYDSWKRLPLEVYALVSNHKVAKELWKRIQLLMQGTSLRKQERECDDPIDAFNHMTSFLSAVVTSRYPPTNNQLRNSSNPRQQATINNGRVKVQPIQGRHTSLAAGTSRTYTSRASENNFEKQKTVVCYNCEGKEGHNHDNVTYNVINQAVQEMSLSEQSNIMNHSETEITMIEQLKTQVVKCTKINLDNKSVNETLTAELKRYKDQVRILKEGNNVDKVSDSCAQSVKIDNLIQTLSEHLKENESLIQTRNRSAQTVHMLTKPQFFYDHTTKQALGFQNPFYLKKAQQLEPKLYDGSVIQKTNAIVIRDSEETLMHAEESRSKMLPKQKDPMMSEKKVNTKPVDYTALNQLSQDFET
nr:hypothetical protein [Tanacetum cinerariifolium]